MDMDTTNERVHFLTNATWDELIEMENRARKTLGVKAISEQADLRKMYSSMVMEQHEHINEISMLRAENTELRARLNETEKALKETKIDLQDKEISFSAIMAILKYYLDFFEALNPSQKALGNAMKKMKKRSERNN